jgi:beta-mannosidase
MKAVLLLLVLLAATQQTRFSQSLTQWTFRYEGAARDYPAIIPSSLAWDLIDNKLVSSDPYYRDNFLQFYQFETKDATYRTSFSIAPTILASKHQYLVFEGLDTHAEVYLNGQHILSAHNMFRRYEVEVKFNRTNDLVVNFTASTKYDLDQERSFKESYGFGLPANYSFTRKAAYQYGWDWGPRILSVGIWKEVFAVLYNDTRV